ncbi:Cleavage stimulation factor subunit 3 [Strongyloides ratti]|uniref:Cleavage stimulation factor subunit 3 n=1 Tax=Strongyloides ratti TaxID=34506 RepID=A0A090MYM9_STRRB|nr:Cleavage stimulation factor subunit 3 [Strongyloides ratti]CEF67464.1 Cleavage stimulation factor subunit 3 [Strongyloides ratti]
MSSLAQLSFDRRIEVNPYDIDAWNSLLKENQTHDIRNVRQFYEKLIAQFPNNGNFWKKYIEHEAKYNNDDEVQNLFSRCLLDVLDIELWKYYISYVKETNVSRTSGLTTYEEALVFAIEHVGNDMNSFDIYMEYIDNCKALAATSDENNSVNTSSAIRKAFRHALSVPMESIDLLYKEYQEMEGECFVETPEGSENIKKIYQLTSTVTQQIENLTNSINRSTVSVPLKGGELEEEQLELWKQYIKFEKKNPLEICDRSTFFKRLNYVYCQALLCFGYSIEIWIDYFEFLTEFLKIFEKEGDEVEAGNTEDMIIKKFTKATQGMMRDAQVLHFAFATFFEERNKIKEAEEVYEYIISQQDLQPSLAYIHYMSFARRNTSIRHQRDIFRRARNDDRVLYQVYFAAAEIEFHAANDATIAIRILELGKQRFSNEIDFMIEYLKFIQMIGDDNNLRVLFEQIVNCDEFTNVELAPVWDMYIRQETVTGDPYSLSKVEHRRRKALEKFCRGKEIHLFIDRLKVNGLVPMSVEDLEDIDYPLSVDYDKIDAMAAKGSQLGSSVCFVNESSPDIDQDQIENNDDDDGNDTACVEEDVKNVEKMLKQLGLDNVKMEADSKNEVKPEIDENSLDALNALNDIKSKEEVVEDILYDLITEELPDSSDDEGDTNIDNLFNQRTRRCSYSSTETEYAESSDENSSENSDNESESNENEEGIALNDARSMVTHHPDTSMMVPYLPVGDSSLSLHPTSGGIFPPPESVMEVIKKCPSSTSFKSGPFVNINKLFELLCKFE